MELKTWKRISWGIWIGLTVLTLVAALSAGMDWNNRHLIENGIFIMAYFSACFLPLVILSNVIYKKKLKGKRWANMGTFIGFVVVAVFYAGLWIYELFFWAFGYLSGEQALFVIVLPIWILTIGLIHAILFAFIFGVIADAKRK